MAENNTNVLRFCTPAKWWGELWREGLYLGNGKIGANVYGGASEEKILLNDASLNWMGRTTVLPDVSDRIEETRARIEEGDFMGAQAAIPTTLQQKNFRPQAEYPLPICELCANFTHLDTVTDFLRALDLQKGEATVSYNVAETRFKRSAFVSRADNVVVFRITKHGAGSITTRLKFSLMNPVNACAQDGTYNVPEGVETKYDRQFMCFAARNDDNGSDYGAVAKLQVLGGSVRPEEDYVDVLHAQSVLLIIKTFSFGSREREWNNIKTQLSSFKEGYDKMFKAHVAIHSKLYDSATVRLSKAEEGNVEDLLMAANAGDMPAALVEKMYKFARYLTIAGIPDDGNAPLFTPTGLWNGSYKPFRAYRSASGELQMTYLHTLEGNLAFNLEKSFDYFWNNVGDDRNNAQRIFGCRGIVVPVVAAPNTGRLGSNDVYAVHFSGCAAWVAGLYYKYAKYSQNTKFLKNRLIPFMKEIALFYEDMLVHTDNGLEIIPSALPMRVADSVGFTDRPVVAKNSVLDFALAKDLLTNLIEACKTCNVKAPLAVWKKLIDDMPANQLASDGTFKEFVNSIISVDYTGISNGTLYPAYFGEEVNFLSDEETKEYYVATADKKRCAHALQNSYNMTVLGAVYARLGEGDKANLCLTNAVRGSVINNLAFVDEDWRGMGICGNGIAPPIQLNVNMAFAHVVQQMLLYSRDEVISIFPALPNSWKNVKFSGLLAECGVSVFASLDADKGVMSVKLESKKEAYVNLYLPKFIKKLIKTNLGVKPEGNNFDVTVPANGTVELQYKVKIW